ncbi:MAG TPA: hypothetical protein EYG94_03770 [Campylobacterales bacterium]|nr:hypothetical protein [Campylobacterales bacterium]
MQELMMISENKLEKLAKRLSNEFTITQEEAFEIIYEEWELVEELFSVHTKAKIVKEYLVREINDIYRIA